jgi:hypothetical protein
LRGRVLASRHERLLSATDAAVPSRADALTGRDQEVDRYEVVRQYSRAQIFAVWAAAAIPMGFLAWVGD